MYTNNSINININNNETKTEEVRPVVSDVGIQWALELGGDDPDAVYDYLVEFSNHIDPWRWYEEYKNKTEEERERDRRRRDDLIKEVEKMFEDCHNK